MLLIGLTGPSGAGKSTVSILLSSFGLPILDADVIYHRLLTPPSDCLNEIAAHFGREILLPDGTLDRRALGKLVFEDDAEREHLNRIAHSYILQEVRKQVRQLRAMETPAAVFDAPQLFESGADKECSLVISVLADADIRLHRILQRDGISEEDAMRRMQAQKSDFFFRSHSDYVIENDGSPEYLLRQVKTILRETGVITE